MGSCQGRENKCTFNQDIYFVNSWVFFNLTLFPFVFPLRGGIVQYSPGTELHSNFYIHTSSQACEQTSNIQGISVSFIMSSGILERSFEMNTGFEGALFLGYVTFLLKLKILSNFTM